MTLLTELGIGRARPKTTVYSLKDGRGLSLRIEPNGAKLWHFRFYWQGKQQRISLGCYPDVGLVQARQRREDARALVASGIDPRVQLIKSGELLAKEAHCLTFAEFAEHWKQFKLKKLGQDTVKNRQSTRVQIERYLRKDLLPHLGQMALNEISAKDILITLRSIEARGALSIAEKCRSWLNELFRHAIAEGHISINPVTAVNVVLLPCRPVNHNPYLQMEQLPPFLKALSHYQGDRRIQLGVKLLLLTAVRPGELRYAEPAHFDLSTDK